jgi:general secretion pathway protein B
MSLILEALKKSEAERQRAAGPTLLEVRVGQPHRRYPLWALGVGLLLLLNMVLLLVFMWRRPTAPAQDLAAAPPTSAGSAAVAPPVAATPQVPFAPAATPSPATAPQPPGNAATGVAPFAAGTAERPMTPAPAAGAAAIAPTLAAGNREEPQNPADELPAVPSGAPVAPATGSIKVRRDDVLNYASLPSFSELSNNMPPLRLDLHVYAERPGDRYALINMQRVHEGDTLSEGMRVLAITRDGVALDYRGQQFMLHPQQ